MTQTIRVLIVDDHAIVRKGIRVLLSTERDLQVIGEAGNGAEAVAQAQALHPDVILMDLVMPKMDGIEATRQITAQQPGMRILVLTSFAADDKVFPAIKAGALGYLLKDTGPQELVQAIHQVHRGEPSLEPSIARSANGIIGSAAEAIERRAAHAARAGHPAADRARAQQQGDRGAIGHHRNDGADTREQHPGQTSSGEPHPSRAVRAERRAGVAGGHSERGEGITSIYNK